MQKNNKLKQIINSKFNLVLLVKVLDKNCFISWRNKNLVFCPLHPLDFKKQAIFFIVS